MKMSVEVLALGRPVNTKRGQMYVHDLLWRTPDGALVGNYWSDNQYAPGVYDTDGTLESRDGNYTVRPGPLNVQK